MHSGKDRPLPSLLYQSFLYDFQDPSTLREGRSTFYHNDGLESLGIPDLVTRNHILGPIQRFGTIFSS